MKRILSLLILCAFLSPLQAQTRLSLYEEFTGEQCFPCTAINPGLQALTSTNSAKLIHIAYPSPFPVAGPIYTGYRTINDARISYYGISTAPQGRLNGTGLGTGTSSPVPGDAANLTQSDINAAYSAPSPFNITASHAWNSTGDSVTVQLTISTPTAYAPPGAAFRLRIALIEQLHYAAPPGINGERDFPNTVREMFPSAGGTILSSSWTTSQTTSFSVSGLVPKFVNKENASIVVWIQNDADKKVQQVATSSVVPISLDANAAAVKNVAKLQCAAGLASIPCKAVLRNPGTTTLTSARIYYHTDGGAMAFYQWNGNLGAGASTTIQLSPVTVGGGNHYITDSVVSPNGGVDVNAGNNVASNPVAVYNTVGIPLPIANGFEGLGGAIPNGWVLYDADSNGRNFVVTRNIFGADAGFGGSTYFLLHNNYYVSPGETNFAILPKGNLPTGTKTLSFALAHAPYSTENDQLDVMYSTDCGNSWNSVWSAVGSGMTASPATTNYFIPTASDWETKTVDMSAVPTGSMIAFRAVSDFGNGLYLDNIQLASPTGVSNVAELHSVSAFPNPAADHVTIRFGISQQAGVSVEIVDALGRSVVRQAEAQYGAGVHDLPLSLAGLATGAYFVRVSAAGYIITRQLTKV